MAKLSVNEYVDVVRRSGLVEGPKLEKLLGSLPNNGSSDPAEVAQKLIDAKLITPWQNDKLMQGKHSGFVLGKYKLLSHISSGGMSSVYLAEHVLMQRRVAVKVLPPARLEDSSYRERFHLECQVMAALDHPNIVRAHDFDVDGKLHYLVMEYIDGPDLEGVVRKGGPLSYELAANYTRQAADGLGHAHEAGLIHRDMKPANLLVDSRGCIKVLDLGVARITGANDSTSLTLAHKEDVVGTADFLAPEQAINSHNVDFRADIYALGGTFYYMLTGHGPFPDGTMAQKLLAHQTQEPSPITKERADCPAGLVAILQRMMAKKLKARYQTMSEVSDDLGRWLADPSYVPAKPGKAAAAAPKPAPAAAKASVDEPLALEERDRESIDFPLNNLTNVRPDAPAAPLNDGGDEDGGYGLVDLDDSIDEDQDKLLGSGDAENEAAEEGNGAVDDDDSSQQMLESAPAPKKGDGFWDEVLTQIDEPTKKKEPLEPNRPKPSKISLEANKEEINKAVERAQAAEKTPAKPGEKPKTPDKPFSPNSSALVPAGRRDLTKKEDKKEEPKKEPKKEDKKEPAGKSDKDKPKEKEKDRLEPDKPKGGKLRKLTLDNCPACGADLGEGTPVCPQCGFNTVTGAKSDGPMKPMTRPKMDEDEDDKNALSLLKNKYVLAGVGVLALILIVVVVMMAGGGGGVTQIDPSLIPPPPVPDPKKAGTNTPPLPVPPEKKAVTPNPNPNGTETKQPNPNPNTNPKTANNDDWKRPTSLDAWQTEDFQIGAARNDPELFNALSLLVGARKDAQVEALLISLLEPGRLAASSGQSQPAQALNDKVLGLIVQTLGASNTAAAKQALRDMVDGKFKASNDDVYLAVALAEMLSRPNPEWNQLILECFFDPEKHRPAQAGATGSINAEGLRRKVTESFNKMPVSLRTEFGKRLNDKSLSPTLAAELAGKLSDPSPANVPAQVEMYMSGKLSPTQETAFQKNFINYGQSAVDVLIAGKPLSEGGPSVSQEEAQAIAASLWQERVVRGAWDRFRAISEPSKEAEQRQLLQLSASLPIGAARAEMAGLIDRFWKNLDPSLWADKNGDFGAGWGDPALWITVKTGPDRIPPPRNTTPKIENKWFTASRQYLKVLNQRFHNAALAKPTDPSAGDADRPIKPHDNSKVTAEFRLNWPDDLATKTPGVAPLKVHYLRVEDRGKLEELDRNHYLKGFAQLPKRRTLQQVQGIEDARWLDSVREVDGKIQTLDVLFTRVRPQGAPSGDEDLVIEILMMETPK